MKGDHEVIAIIIMTGLGIVAGSATTPAGVALFKETLVWAGTLVAAFAGAWFAFRFQAEAAKTKEQRDSRIAGNMAVLTLMRQWNWLANYKKQSLDEHVHHPLRMVAIQASLQADEEMPSIDLASLAFLADSTSSSSLNGTMLFELKLVEEEFRTVRAAIVQRSEIRSNYLEPAMEAAGLVSGQQVMMSIEDVRAALGETKYNQLKDLTDHIYGLEDTMARIIAVKDDLRAAIRREFPESKSYDFSDPTLQTASTAAEQ